MPAAASAFAAKFSDIRDRRRVLFGEDPFAHLVIPRAAAIARLKQVLLNTTLRLRASYVERGLRDEQLARVLAEAAGPVRVAAATLLELEGHRPGSPREAFLALAGEAGEAGGEAAARLSQAREKLRLPPGAATATLFALLDLLQSMRRRTDALR